VRGGKAYSLYRGFIPEKLSPSDKNEESRLEFCQVLRFTIWILRWDKPASVSFLENSLSI
jgi:hypothetical protein